MGRKKTFSDSNTRMDRRLLFILGMIGFLAVAGGVVYLAATPSAPRPAATPGTPSFGQFQPIATPGGAIGVAPREGARAPSFSGPRFGGGTLSLADLRGKGVVMNFFASWCAPCRAEARDLEAMYQKYRARGIIFLAVDIQPDTWDDARKFLQEFAITYPAIRDETGEIMRKYHMVGLPTTYFIDKEGIVRSKFVGPFLGREGLKELERRIWMILP